jgi:exopolysaccharide biosynthesis polyprenyl glycosylphosphotransferase
MKKAETIFTVVLVPVDYLMMVGAGLTAYFLRTSDLIAVSRPVLFGINLPLEKYLWLVFFMAFFMVIIFALSGLYRIRRANGILEDLTHVIISISAGLAGIIIYSFARREWFDSRFLIFASWALAILFVIFGRLILRTIQHFLVSHYRVGVHNVLLIGGDRTSNILMEEIKNRPALGYSLVGYSSDLNVEKIKEIVYQKSVDDIILANPNFSREAVLDLIDLCEEKHLNFRFVPNLFQALTVNVQFDTLSGIPMIELRRTALGGWGRIIKRSTDVLLSLFCLVIFSPLMLLVFILVKLDSPGPAIYKNQRVSPRGLFSAYKFRSMKIEYCTGPEYDKDGRASRLEDELVKKQSGRQGPVFKVINDPRRTKLGLFLEKSSIDELPQFFNALMGNMSLVGPRPHMPKEVAGYEKWHKKVFNIQPGITGLAQISGRSEINFDEEAKLDIYYIENWSLWLDLKILLKTPLVVLFGRWR